MLVGAGALHFVSDFIRPGCYRSFSISKRVEMSKSSMITAVVVSLFSATAFAAGGGIDIPGFGSATGTTGSEVTNSNINVMNNKSTKVTAGGGKVGGYGVSAEMKSAANVNSVVINGSKVKDSTINVIGNESKDVNAYGGTANVNSVSIN